jgi:hypothetical protein
MEQSPSSEDNSYPAGQEIHCPYGIQRFITVQVEVFWFVTPCSVAIGYQCFGGPCCLHLHFTLKVEAA